MAKPNIEQGISTASSHLRWNVGSVSDLASSRVREAGSGHHGKSCKPLAQVQGSQEDQGDLENPRTRIMFATWNLGALNIMLKWWRLCRGDESTSVVCRNTGIWVLLNPTSSIFLWTRNANSISSVLKPRYYWQRIRKTKFLKSSASLTFLARSFFSSWSSARCFSPYLPSVYASQVDPPETEKEPQPMVSASAPPNSRGDTPIWSHTAPVVTQPS